MEELWYPKPERDIPGRRNPVSEKQIDYLVDPRRGRMGGGSPLKLKIGMIYVTTNQDIEILGYPRDGTVKARMLETGVVAEHFPVRAIIARKRQQSKEKPTMQQVVPSAVSVVTQQPEQQSDAVTMTSLELVDFINSLRHESLAPVLTHSDFKKKVKKVLSKDHGNFSGIFLDGYGREQEMYIFPKREATLMAMSYSHEISAQVYDKMEALEKQVQSSAPNFGGFQIPQTLGQALLLAGQQQMQIEEQKQQLTLAAPKVAFVDNFVGRGENLTATAIGKKLNVTAQSINKWLVKKDALFNTRKHFKQWYLDKGYGVEKFVIAHHDAGKVVSSIYHTPAGATWILQNFDIREV